MDLTKFQFQKVLGFSSPKIDKILLEEAKERGFYNGYTPYNKLFSKLFFSGGKVKFKAELNEDFRSSAWKYCRAIMGGWDSKHEEKEAVCSLIMSEILEPELDEN